MYLDNSVPHISGILISHWLSQIYSDITGSTSGILISHWLSQIYSDFNKITIRDFGHSG